MGSQPRHPPTQRPARGRPPSRRRARSTRGHYCAGVANPGHGGRHVLRRCGHRRRHQPLARPQGRRRRGGRSRLHLRGGGRPHRTPLPLAFVSAVREIFDGLVTVGGGISDGYSVASAIATGADLAHMGTRFLATTESQAPAEYKQMVVEHGSADLVVSSGVKSSPASWLQPSLARHGIDPDTLTFDGGSPTTPHRNPRRGGAISGRPDRAFRPFTPSSRCRRSRISWKRSSAAPPTASRSSPGA